MPMTVKEAQEITERIKSEKEKRIANAIEEFAKTIDAQMRYQITSGRAGNLYFDFMVYVDEEICWVRNNVEDFLDRVKNLYPDWSMDIQFGKSVRIIMKPISKKLSSSLPVSQDDQRTDYK